MAQNPDDIILARRRKGYGSVSVDVPALLARDPSWTPEPAALDQGLIHEGDVIPMRREEAEGREDFEVVGERAVSQETARED